MEHQVAIDIPLTTRDRLLNRLPWLLLSIMIVTIGLYYNDLPDEVPIHFGASGQPDNYTGRNGLFVLPVIYGLVSWLMLYLAKIPHKHNYIIDITPENRLRQYRLAQNMLRALSIVVGVVFTLIVWQTIQVALAEQSGLSIWFFITLLVGIFGTIGVYIYLAVKRK